MLKRIVVIGVIGVSFAVTRGDVAKAHLAGTVYNPTYRHIASYDCTGTFAQVPSLDQHPALFECVAVVSEYEVLCENPQGKVNFGNSGPRTVGQIAEDFITEDDLTDKTKGKAIKTVLLPDTVLTDAHKVCKARNRNWRARDEFVTSVDVTLKSFDCPNSDSGCTGRIQAFEALLHCNRPINPANGLPYTLNPRLSNPPPPPCPDGDLTCPSLTNWPTPYDCTVVEEAHCDAGDTCPIP